jgi:hypothetical protein
MENPIVPSSPVAFMWASSPVTLFVPVWKRAESTPLLESEPVPLQQR